MAINAAEGELLPSLDAARAVAVGGVAIAPEARVVGPTMEAPRQGRGVGPGHAVRALAGRVDAAQVVDGRVVLVIPLAIGPLEAKELGVRGVVLKVEAFSLEEDPVDLGRVEGRVTDPDIGVDARRVEAEVEEDVEVAKAMPASPPVILLHAAEVGLTRAAIRVAPNGGETQLSGVDPPAVDGVVAPGVGRRREVARAVACQAKAAMEVVLRPPTPGGLAVPVVAGRSRRGDASEGAAVGDRAGAGKKGRPARPRGVAIVSFHGEYSHAN